MASEYVKELRGIADNLRSEGWDLRANVLDNAADRMERMEDLIVSMKENIIDPISEITDA